MSEKSSGSPLKGEMGNTTISNTVVTQIAGMAAQEVENAQMSGGASAAVGGILQSVTGGSTGGGNYSRGVNVEVGEEEAAVDLTMTVDYGQSIPRIAEAARSNVINRPACDRGEHTGQRRHDPRTTAGLRTIGQTE